MPIPASLVLLTLVAAAVLLSLAYFRRYQVARPPLGVLGGGDVAAMLGAIVVVPFLYLALPAWLVAALLGVALLSILSAACEPMLGARAAVWAVVVSLLGADLGLALVAGPLSWPFVALNDLVLVLAVVGATNLWAQSGMKARDGAILAGALALYDVVATSLLPLMVDLVGRVAGLPFHPLLAWPLADGRWLGLGLGDLLLAAVFPLLMRKAYGRTAALLAVALSLAAIAVLLALLELGVLRGTLPAMVALGPVMLLQYGAWRRARGRERTTWQYLQAEPLPARGGPAPARDLVAATA